MRLPFFNRVCAIWLKRTCPGAPTPLPCRPIQVRVSNGVKYWGEPDGERIHVYSGETLGWYQFAISDPKNSETYYSFAYKTKPKDSPKFPAFGSTPNCKDNPWKFLALERNPRDGSKGYCFTINDVYDPCDQSEYVDKRMFTIDGNVLRTKDKDGGYCFTVAIDENDEVLPKTESRHSAVQWDIEFQKNPDSLCPTCYKETYLTKIAKRICVGNNK